MGVFKRGEAPIQILFPLSFKGEGDTGGEVDKRRGMGEMKDLVKLSARPKLDSPSMLAVWPGIGDVAVIVAMYLERKMDFKEL